MKKPHCGYHAAVVSEYFNIRAAISEMIALNRCDRIVFGFAKNNRHVFPKIGIAHPQPQSPWKTGAPSGPKIVCSGTGILGNSNKTLSLHKGDRRRFPHPAQGTDNVVILCNCGTVTAVRFLHLFKFGLVVFWRAILRRRKAIVRFLSVFLCRQVFAFPENPFRPVPIGRTIRQARRQS